MPSPICKQVTRLLGLQNERRRLKEEYQKELQELERKYFAKSNPLYQERAKVVSGATFNGDLKSHMKGFLGSSAGIPEFWLLAMQGHISVSDLIQHWDKEALTYLTDIRVEYLKPPILGYRLLFDFAENDFFTNRMLSKTCTYETGDDNAGLFYGEVLGDRICWKPSRELPPFWDEGSNESQNQAPPESFFDFFRQQKYSPNDYRDIDMVEMELALDYGYGEVFKDKLIPDAVDWFTGEAADDGHEEEADDENNGWIWSHEHNRYYRQTGVDEDGNSVCVWEGKIETVKRCKTLACLMGFTVY